MKRVLAALALGALAPAAAAAQVQDRPGLTLDGARRVIAAAFAEARRLEAPGGVIAVVDEGGHPIALERLDGTFAAGATISIGKARTAVLFRRPTRVFEDLINERRTAMTALPDALFTPLQGGVPIEVDGRVVGGIGVSGAASAQQDEDIALAGAAAAKDFRHGAAAAEDVTYFDRARVAAAFAKGDVLVNGDGGRNYMIHASRREEAGVAEVHVDDADIIYVLGGGATFVTGGTLVDGTTVAPGEFRGPSIAGGETRALAPGDVIVVPRGTPHWFRAVDAPFTYYVVKVR